MESGVLPYDVALKIGLENNINLKTQVNQLYSSQAQKRQSIGNFIPSFNLGGLAQRTNGLQIDPRTGEGGNVRSDYIQAGLQANYVLFNGFGRLNGATIRFLSLHRPGRISSLFRRPNLRICVVASRNFEPLPEKLCSAFLIAETGKC